jgi:DNA polymerase elongation subunit (family B)
MLKQDCIRLVVRAASAAVFTKMEEVLRLIQDGYSIKWVGYHSPMKVHVHLTMGKVTKRLVVELQKDYTLEHFRQVYSSSASSPATVTGTIWSSDSRLELLRLASILGLNIGGTCVPGCGQQSQASLGCVMAYDIESDRSRIPMSSFGGPSESITSIAFYCSCGYGKVFSFIPGVEFDYVLCRDSRDTVSTFFKYVKEHSPQWLLGYNNFGYDNTRIAYHSDEKLDSILIPMRIGSGSSLTYAFYIDIEGVYNADLMTYLDKTRRGTYPNMRLATLVKHHGIQDKMDFDTYRVKDFKELFEYNLHDCKITMELAFKSGAIVEIMSLCSVACVPVIDSVRFVTGTFAACAIASYSLKNSISMDWSPCGTFQGYRGAEVLEPVIGVHEDVVSCDFSSMYPTVMLGANISIENCTTMESVEQEGSTWKSGGTSNFIINDTQVTFSDLPGLVIPPVVQLFVDLRKKVKYINTVEAQAQSNALKVTANSIYGSLGDSNSKIYSPLCSASITTGGRWCLAVAQTILKAYGYEVVYGDTDSCYVKRTERSKYNIEDVLKVMKEIFVYTPFPGMSMELEESFARIVFLGKKTYFGKTTKGKIVSKGMSKSRKDRIGVCRTLASNVVETILLPIGQREMLTIVADMVSVVLDLVVTRGLLLSDVSKYVKKGGSNYFEYKSADGTRETLECETYTGNEIVEYSAKEIASLVAREMKSLLAVSGLGSLGYVLRYSSII